MKDKLVDEYIAKAAPFAQPIMKKLRALVHKACPAMTEELKWNAPAFMHHGIVIGMVAFKAHVRFGFWRARELDDPDGLFRSDSASFMNSNHLTDVKELPADKVLINYIRAAAKLNAASPRKFAPRTTQRKPATVPAYLKKALAGNTKAKATFENFSPSNQREYVEWITKAKREETRAKQIATALEWMAEGRQRNWKYK
jgi:hypothetical protein